MATHVRKRSPRRCAHVCHRTKSLRYRDRPRAPRPVACSVCAPSPSDSFVRARPPHNDQLVLCIYGDFGFALYTLHTREIAHHLPSLFLCSYFTQPNSLQVRPRGRRWQGSALSRGRPIFHCVYEPSPLYPSVTPSPAGMSAASWGRRTEIRLASKREEFYTEHRRGDHLVPAGPCATRLGLEPSGSAAPGARAHL